MRRNLSRAIVVMACALSACDSGGNAAPDTLGTLESVATLPPTTSTDPAAPSTLPAATIDDGTLGLSPDGPWRQVDSAPGVTTPGLFYELMPKLWVYLPLEEDIPNGITWVLNEADLPIIEAYLQARLVFFRATNADPIDLADEGWATWYQDEGSAYFSVLGSRRDRHEIFDRDQGVVLRPYVVGEARTDEYAIVLDCMLDGGVWRLPDGSLGSGSTPGVVNNGLGAELVLVDGRWVAGRVTNEAEACV